MRGTEYRVLFLIMASCKSITRFASSWRCDNELCSSKADEAPAGHHELVQRAGLNNYDCIENEDTRRTRAHS